MNSMNNHRLRALLLRLQDRLSDNDRKRLHFFLGNDVPRRIRDDPTLGGTLCLMESLFDQDKINEEDFSFLINTFDEIQCLDAVKLLREHMKQMQSNGLNESIQSLSLLMPSLADTLLQDQDDKYSIQTHIIDQTNIYGNNNTIISNRNRNDDSISVSVNNSEELLSPKLCRKSSMTKGSMIAFILLSIILVALLVGGPFWIVKLNKMNYDKIFNEKLNNTRENRYGKDSRLENNTEIVRLSNVLSQRERTIKEMKKKLKLLEDNQRNVHGNDIDSSFFVETTLEDYIEPVQFRFNKFSSVKGWWCVYMRENSIGWYDNYLCTSRDIGLTWKSHPVSCHESRKCVAAVDPFKRVWNDNSLCLPGNSSIELVWSYCGPLVGMECIVLDKESTGADFLDYHICWKEH